MSSDAVLTAPSPTRPRAWQHTETENRQSVFFQTASESPAESAARLQETSRLILESAGEGVYGLDLDGFVTFVNPAARRMTGWSIEDLRGHTQHSMVHHSYADGRPYPRELCPIYLALRDGQVHHREDEVFWRKNATCFPVSYTSTPLVQDGHLVGAVIIFSDISRRVQEQEWEKKKAQLFSSIIGQRPLRETLTCLVAAFHRFGNGYALTIHVREGDNYLLAAESGLSTVSRERVADLQIPASPASAPFSTPAWEAALPGDLSCATLRGSRPAMLRACHPLFTLTGEVIGVVSAFGCAEQESATEFQGMLAEASDFARLAIEHAALQSRLSHQAEHDTLTGLPNRSRLEDRLDQAIRSARRHGSYLGVCYIDLDRFKEVNDTLGHTTGDRFLVQVSSILKRHCRDIDTLARQGGDEFILLLPDLASPEEAQQITERLLDELRLPFCIGEAQFSPTASIGISIFPGDGENSGLLLQNADMALYAAKRAGKNRIQIFDVSFGEQFREHTWINTGLQFALAKDQFRLVYQPIFSVRKELQGFEALLRWDHPDGLIPPDRFIPIAEESGLIVPIGAWVLRMACKQAAAWQTPGRPAVRISVNVSGVQLNLPGFVDTVAGALQASGLAPTLLQLEITETWIVADPKATAAQLRKLRTLGVTFSVDDFGSGHSSFRYLHELPIDTLKIDRSFIARLDGTAKQLSTIRAIVMMSRQLGLRTVAEGVETEEQLQELATIDCDLFQGFLLAKPLSMEDASALLRNPPQA